MVTAGERGAHLVNESGERLLSHPDERI